MKGRIVKDWSKVDWTNEKHVQQVFGAVNHFMRPMDNPKIKAAFQHFTQTGDFPASVLPLLQRYYLTPNFDEGWREIFDVLDFTSTPRNGFRILDVEDTLTFDEVPTGEKVNIHKVGGSIVDVTFARYGGGLGWDKTLIDDREWYAMEQSASVFRNKAMLKKAQIHYALIEAVSSAQNLAWQVPVPAALAATDPNYAAIRDIETINAACTGILVDVKDKGYGTGVATEFILLAPIQLQSRVRRAMGLLNANLAGSQLGLNFNVRPVYTMMLSSTSSYYIILPKVKIQSGNRMDLTVGGKFDVESYSEIAVGWMRFGAAIGDSQQIRRCATS